MRLLLVEDDSMIGESVLDLLRAEQYAVDWVRDGDAADTALRTQDYDLVLLDLGLPRQDGLSVLRRLRARRSRVPVLIATARDALAQRVEGLDAGADDFLAKPYESAILLARMRSALRLREAMAGMEAAHGVVAALANAVEAKDSTTENHCQRLAAHAHRIGEAIGMTGTELRMLTYGARLHDIGKIGVAESILSKPGPLTDLEWAEMRRHPEIGEQICKPLATSRDVAPIIRHHHERWDGTGYPDGIRSDGIPIGARIVALADAFDAMINDRPYRAALGMAAAVDQIRSGAGRQFDPELVPVFLELLAAGPPAPVPVLVKALSSP